MDSNSVFMLLDFLVAGSGVYVIYQYLIMKKTGEVRQTMLLPKDLNVKKCKDPAAFIAEVSAKQLLFGIMVLLCGSIGLISDFTDLLGPIVYLVAVAVFLVVTVWFSGSVKKAVKKYW